MSTAILSARLDKSGVRSVYTKLSPIYDLWARLTEGRARRAALDRAAIRDGEAVLEVAVGTGLAFAEVLRRNRTGQNEGLDLTPAMLARARRRAERTADGANFRLIEGDAYALPYPDASFDLVLNSYMFDLLPEEDFGKVLAELRRVLIPGGRLVLTNMTTDQCAFRRIPELVYRIRPELMGGCRGVLLEPYLAAAAFSEIDRQVVFQLGVPSEVVFAVRPKEAP